MEDSRPLRSTPEETAVKSPRWVVAILFFVVSFLFFYITSAPGMGTEDSAELTAGARLLTIVHAPGYPLYLLAGHLAESLFEFPGRGLVLLSAAAGALTIALFFALMRVHFGEMAAAAGAVSLLFCSQFWNASTEAEVYSIQVLFILLCFDSVLRLRVDPSERGLRWVAFIFGVALSHHVGLVIHLPAFAVFLLYELRGRFPQKGWRAAGYFAAGLALYLTLMIHSNRGDIPLISWNPVYSISDLYQHATGAGFKRWLFAVPADEAMRRLFFFPLVTILWFSLLSGILIAIGIVVLLRNDLHLALLLSAVAGVTFFHTANYAVIDPESFLVPAIVPAVIFGAAGYRALESVAHLRDLRALGVALLFISAIVGKLYAGGFMTPAFRTWPVDTAREILVEHDRRNFGSNLAADTSLIWADWRFYPTLRCLQLVEGIGATVEIEMDSTSETPGSKYVAGRTWSMRPSDELGGQYALIMDSLHWRVLKPEDLDDASAEVSTPDLPAMLTFEGIDVVDARELARAAAKRIVRVSFTFRVPAGVDGEVADTIGGYLRLLRRKTPILSTPFRIHRWNRPPSSLTPGVLYTEELQTLLPSAHFDDPAEAEYSLELHFESARSSAVLRVHPAGVAGGEGGGVREVGEGAAYPQPAR